MIRKSLAVKIGLSIIGLVFVVLLTLYLSISQMLSSAFYRQAGEELLTQGQEYANMISSSGPMMTQMICMTSDASLVVFDQDGNPRARSGSVSLHEPNSADRTEIQTALKGQSVIHDGYSSMFGATGVVAITPIIQDGTVIGLVGLFRPESIISVAFSHVEWLLFLAGIGALLLAIGLVVVLSNRIARPLKQMETATKELGQGHYETRISVVGEDEVARLGTAINDLAKDLNRLQTTRNEFLADVSHELRTPLSYIRGYSQVLIDGLEKSPEEQHQYLNIIHDESERIERLVSDLFALAQADEGVLSVVKEPVHLEEVVRDVTERIQHKASDKGISLHLSAGSFPKVMIDPRRMEQLMFNLLDNAIRYTEPGGDVSVRIDQIQDSLRVSVEDTGIGIPQEELPYIWNRLYRVEKSRSRDWGGTGLGLAIVKQIVELHGGTVNAESIEGKGTTITFTLPFEKENASRETN